jgi:hypothetical protein
MSILGQTVDRCRRCGDDFADASARRGLEHVERSVHQHLEREAWFFRALRDPNCRLMEQNVCPPHQLADERRIADVSGHEAHSSAGEGAGEVFAASPDEVVENHDLAGLGLHELIDEV